MKHTFNINKERGYYEYPLSYFVLTQKGIPMKKTLIGACLLFSTFALSTQAIARDQIRVVGSSTVYPFTTTVAELFGKLTEFKSPIVESTGTGGGFKIFCAGVGAQHPDFNNASRAIKKGEVKMCAKNGVTVTELKVGYDGIVLANSKDADQLSITRRELFLALAKQIPDGKGGLIENPNQKWSDVNPSLSNKKIEVLGPPPTSGTRDAFVELVMESGAKTFPELKALRKKNKKDFKAIAHAVREDGVFIEAGENDNLIIQKLVANPNAYGIFGFSFLDTNLDKIQGSMIEKVSPTFENIASGDYSVSRPLFVYGKNEHLNVVPGMKEFVRLYLSDKMTSEEGALADKGLIPLPAREKKTLVAQVEKNLK